MVVVEHKLRDLVQLMPEIVINENYSNTPHFGWGTKEELNRNLKEYGSNIYPLIWLLPSVDNYKHKRDETVKKCHFVIAALEEKVDLLNRDRYNYNFDIVLNPLTNRLIEGFKKSSTTDILNDDISIFKRPNYTEKDSLIDLWDAVEVEIDVKFNNNCLRDIKWQSINA